VQNRRTTKAARRLLTRLLKKQGMAPKRIVTDKLRSYGAAKRQLMPDVEHRSHKGLNNRAENSHVPFRKRERMRQGFRSIGSLQHFVSLFPPFAISSFQITQNRLPTKFAITDCKPWFSGKPSAASSSETVSIGLYATVLQTR
jgi:putative transposase